jgi:hypothetical protein
LFNPPHNQENGQTATARQAAEALFTPKKQEHHALSPEPENAVAHKPRILAALPPAQPDIASPAKAPKPEKRGTIPKLQVDRVRAWLRYGMTVGQAADVCAVSVSDLTRALRPHAGHGGGVKPVQVT